ncbi:MAG: WD40 repeat domain-containing protein, partial [Verrucomicrobiales bacterium]|nr:WD40 repeat domain-containing protein [Verrucomicrobiales bacterium]
YDMTEVQVFARCPCFGAYVFSNIGSNIGFGFIGGFIFLLVAGALQDRFFHTRAIESRKYSGHFFNDINGTEHFVTIFDGIPFVCDPNRRVIESKLVHPEHNAWTCVESSLTGAYIAAADGMKLTIWQVLIKEGLVNPLTNYKVTLSHVFSSPILCLKFTPDDKIVLGHLDGSISVFDKNRKEIVFRSRNWASYPVDTLTSAGKKGFFLVGRRNGMVELFDIDKLKIVGEKKLPATIEYIAGGEGRFICALHAGRTGGLKSERLFYKLLVDFVENDIATVAWNPYNEFDQEFQFNFISEYGAPNRFVIWGEELPESNKYMRRNRMTTDSDVTNSHCLIYQWHDEEINFESRLEYSSELEEESLSVFKTWSDSYSIRVVSAGTVSNSHIIGVTTTQSFTESQTVSFYNPTDGEVVFLSKIALARSRPFNSRPNDYPFYSAPNYGFNGESLMYKEGFNLVQTDLLANSVGQREIKEIDVGGAINAFALWADRGVVSTTETVRQGFGEVENGGDVYRLPTAEEAGLPLKVPPLGGKRMSRVHQKFKLKLLDSNGIITSELLAEPSVKVYISANIDSVVSNCGTKSESFSDYKLQEAVGKPLRFQTFDITQSGQLANPKLVEFENHKIYAVNATKRIIALYSETRNEVNFANLSTKQIIDVWKVDGGVRELKFSRDGSRILAICPNRLFVYDVNSQISVYEQVGLYFNGLAELSSDGKLMLLTSSRGLEIHNFDTGAILKRTGTEGVYPLTAEFSPDSKGILMKWEHRPEKRFRNSFERIEIIDSGSLRVVDVLSGFPAFNKRPKG